MKSELLDYVFESSKETCLSELKIAKHFVFVLDIIDQIPDEKYSLESWKYLIFYIMDKTIEINNVSEAKSYIRKWVQDDTNHTM